MIDLACSGLLLAGVVVASIAYGVRVALHGRVTNTRVEREGKSLLVGKGAMEMFYWALEPVELACARLGITANEVTMASVALAVGAGVALALGHPGVGALLATLAASGDALDGAVARRTNVASDAGKVLDSAADRYSEFAFLGGLAFSLRANEALLALTLFALLASFMVSYSTAKADALHLPLPRGSMRRMDRAVYLILGTALAPLVAWARPDLARAPIVAALALVAVVGNVSAAGRFAALGRKARDRATATPSLSRGRVSTPAAPPPPRAPRPHDVAAAAKLE